MPTARQSRELPLSRRELQFALLYAQGHTLKSVASHTHVTLANVSSAIQHAKTKYQNAGHNVHTRAEVRARLIIDGLLPEPEPEPKPAPAPEPEPTESV